MTYLPYIVAAYAVFALVLAWDALAPWLRQRQLLRAIRLRALRDASRAQGIRIEQAPSKPGSIQPTATNEANNP